jgi:hypothetical protein
VAAPAPAPVAVAVRPAVAVAAAPAAAVAPAVVEDIARSGPAPAIRHSYPLAIQDAGLGTAFGLLMRTLPFLLVRLGILVAFTFLGLAVWAVALLGFWLFKRIPIVGLVWMLMVLEPPAGSGGRSSATRSTCSRPRTSPCSPSS